MTGVESVSNQREMIESISTFVDIVRYIGIGLFIVFIGVSIFLITNTTKITVFSRRREIGIMKYVGATNGFIRTPFIIEGIIIGIFGSAFATLLLYLAYKFIYGYIVSSMFMITLLEPGFIITSLGLGFVGGGVLIGAIGSAIALRKFLDV